MGGMRLMLTMMMMMMMVMMTMMMMLLMMTMTMMTMTVMMRGGGEGAAGGRSHAGRCLFKTGTQHRRMVGKYRVCRAANGETQ